MQNFGLPVQLTALATGKVLDTSSLFITVQAAAASPDFKLVLPMSAGVSAGGSTSFALNVTEVNGMSGRPDDRTEANCVFSGEDSPPDGKRSFRDSIWIKQYNGASRIAGNYIAWIETDSIGYWQINPLNEFGVNYVNRVCSVQP